MLVFANQREKIEHVVHGPPGEMEPGGPQGGQPVEIEGLEHLRAALEQDNGVILFSAHFTSFEFFFPSLRKHCPRLSGMYKVQRNPLMNEVMNEGRGRNIDFLSDFRRSMGSSRRTILPGSETALL